MENEIPKKEFKRESSTYGLTQPSRAHKEATESAVYRLSELMFGSLLASYVLGFIGFSAPHAAKAFASGDITVLYPEVLAYLFVSMSFAYLTAGLYISYHAGILTMPHFPFSNLRWDFLIALLQSVLFGISMLLPLWLPLCVAIVLFASVWRQHGEYKAFINKLQESLRINEDQIDQKMREWKTAQKREKFKLHFSSELEHAPSLNLWWKLSSKTIYGAALLTIVGTIALFLPSLTPDHAKICVLLLTFAVFVGMMFAVNRVLRDRADFMYDDENRYEIDKQFWKFVDQLAKGSRKDAEQA